MSRITLTVLLLAAAAVSAAETKPNIVYVLCDDLGYGDVRALNPDGKIATPHMDRLAREGLVFTDAHSGSGVCTPTRYGVMTGRYAWRTKLQNGVLGGLSPRLIEPERLTAASLLKQHGYHTACIGKWHLGLDWVKKPGKKVNELGIEGAELNWNVDFEQPFAGGPTAVGFDYYYGISASLDMVPYSFLENDRVTVIPTVEKSFPMMLGKKANTRKGPAAEEFDAEDVLPKLTAKAAEYVAARAADAKAGKPFFLYLPVASPHTPIVPKKEWQSKSGINPYADFVMQTDAALGELLAALDQHGVADNTLVIFTSDNGCSPQADYAKLAESGHNPSYKFRGTKADIYEGGHRVPFLVRMPGKLGAGRIVAHPVCLTDLVATCAEIVGTKLPDDAAEDSFSLLPLLKGGEKSARDHVVHHSINGSFALREGDWKLCFCAGSGGWSPPQPAKVPANAPEIQLFNLAIDIGEQANVQAEQPEIVERLSERMQTLIDRGRSTPGEPQKNAVAVKLRKAG